MIPYSAHIYLRNSKNDKFIHFQNSIIKNVEECGFISMHLYQEKNPGAINDYPELLRMMQNFKDGDFVIIEKLDQISKLPITSAVTLANCIQSLHVTLIVPELIDLSDIIETATDDNTKEKNKFRQEFLMRTLLKMSQDECERRLYDKNRDNYKGRKPDKDIHQKIINYHLLNTPVLSIKDTADKLQVSESTVIRVCREFRNKNGMEPSPRRRPCKCKM